MPGPAAHWTRYDYFPTARARQQAALEVCQRCPVLAECREWALSGRHLLGTIVGGMTPDERRREWRTRIPRQGNHTRAGLRAELLALIISQPGWPAGYIEQLPSGSGVPPGRTGRATCLPRQAYAGVSDACCRRSAGLV